MFLLYILKLFLFISLYLADKFTFGENNLEILKDEVLIPYKDVVSHRTLYESIKPLALSEVDVSFPEIERNSIRLFCPEEISSFDDKKYDFSMRWVYSLVEYAESVYTVEEFFTKKFKLIFSKSKKLKRKLINLEYSNAASAILSSLKVIRDAKYKSAPVNVEWIYSVYASSFNSAKTKMRERVDSSSMLMPIPLKRRLRNSMARMENIIRRLNKKVSKIQNNDIENSVPIKLMFGLLEEVIIKPAHNSLYRDTALFKYKKSSSKIWNKMKGIFGKKSRNLAENMEIARDVFSRYSRFL